MTDVIVPGGSTPGTATNLGTYITNNPSGTRFILQAGYYLSVNITRAGITVISEVDYRARFQQRTVSINAANVTVHGLTIVNGGTPVEVFSPGVVVSNNRISGFGKTTYGNGILVHKEALNPSNHVRISCNLLDDWGGFQFAGGIAIGAAADTPDIDDIRVEVSNNSITNGPTTPGVMSGAIQTFHPMQCNGNYINQSSGSAIQNKAHNCHIYCNEVVNAIGDGCLYNRDDSGNLWENNIVHDCYMGIDHFMGNNVIFRGNVIYNCSYLGNIKDQGFGTNNLLFENNTFYVSNGWAGFIWDITSGEGPVQNVLWRRNIFQACPAGGNTIDENFDFTAQWDEYENVFYNTTRPTFTTGYITGSSIVVNPNFVNPPVDFTAQAPQCSGRGATWPRPC